MGASAGLAAFGLSMALAGSAWADCAGGKSITVTEQQVNQALQLLVTASGANFQIEMQWAPALTDLSQTPAAALGPNMAPNDQPYAVVWVSSTLMDEVSSPDEVAFVLAHEVVHLVQGRIPKLDDFLQKAYEQFKPKITPSDAGAPKPPQRWDQLTGDDNDKFWAATKDVFAQAKKTLEREADSEGTTLYLNTFPKSDPDAPTCAVQHLGEFDEAVVALGLAKAQVNPSHDPPAERAQKLRDLIAKMK
jgi:hypothetical protein